MILPIYSTEEGIFTSSKLHLEKAASPIDFSAVHSPRLTFAKLEQYKNACLPIEIKPAGNTISAIPVFLNAQVPIYFNVEGRRISLTSPAEVLKGALSESAIPTVPSATVNLFIDVSFTETSQLSKYKPLSFQTPSFVDSKALSPIDSTLLGIFSEASFSQPLKEFRPILFKPSGKLTETMFSQPRPPPP